MRTNRLAIYVLTPLTIIALILAIVLRHCSDFTSNVFLSIFGSALLTLIIAIINYCTERRKTCEAFWANCHKVKRNYYKYHSEYSIEKKVNTVFIMNDFDYSALDNAYADFAFLFNNKKLRKEIYDNLYNKTKEARNQIALVAFHLNVFENATNGNVDIMERYIKKLDDYFFVREEVAYPQEDGTVVRQISVRNRIVDDMFDYLEKDYYDLMYPFKIIKKTFDRFKNNKEISNAD